MRYSKAYNKMDRLIRLMAGILGADQDETRQGRTESRQQRAAAYPSFCKLCPQTTTTVLQDESLVILIYRWE